MKPASGRVMSQAAHTQASEARGKTQLSELLFPTRLPTLNDVTEEAERAALLSEVMVSFAGEPMSRFASASDDLAMTIVALRRSVSNPTDTSRQLKPYDAFSVETEAGRWRVSVLPSSGDGRAWCKASRVLNDIPDLHETALGKINAAAIAGLRFRRGALLVVGEGGAGKTVMASSILKEWVQADGGFSVALRDVAELPLQSRISRGQVLEIDYQQSTISTTIDPLLQWRANPVYLNEIRSAEQAAAFLRIVTSGHLCITTLHASGIGEALSSLETMLPGYGDQMRQILASSLLGIVHVFTDTSVLRIRNANDRNYGEAIRRASVLYSPAAEEASKFRIAIKERDSRALSQMADGQQTRLTKIEMPEELEKLKTIPGNLFKHLKV